MISSISGLAPFPLLILLGIFLGVLKIFDLQNARTFNLFIFYIAIPCVIFEAVTKSNLEGIKFGLLASYFIMQTLAGFIAFYVTNKFFQMASIGLPSINAGMKNFMSHESIVNTDTQDEFIAGCGFVVDNFEKLSKSSFDLAQRHSQKKALSLFKSL